MTSSSQEKTRNKLMDSMRKTKESATGKIESTATAKNVEKKQPQHSKATAAKKPARAATKKATKKPARTATKKATKKPARAASKKATKIASNTAAGQYMAGQRVWPD